MTEQEFIAEWCAKMDHSPSVFKTGKRVAVRCYCGGNGCKGWKALVSDPDRLREHMESDGKPGGWINV